MGKGVATIICYAGVWVGVILGLLKHTANSSMNADADHTTGAAMPVEPWHPVFAASQASLEICPERLSRQVNSNVWC